MPSKHWEDKKAELEKKFYRRNILLSAINISIACAAVIMVVKGCGNVQAKEAKKFEKIRTEYLMERQR
ncbi:MAG: hypothetical protein J6R22_04875 [Alphaproteobacteria bacterium]|nr:hypothetical protein [Alphaproteobacteria bacterium]